MYMKRMLEVGKVENGYVVEVRVPIKEGKEKEYKNMPCTSSESEEKRFIASDEKELSALIEKLMPMLEEEFTSEDEFDAAFEKVAK